MNLSKINKSSLYLSETSQFLNQLKNEIPELEKNQCIGRALLWDKKIDFDEQKVFKQSRYNKKAYEYYDYSEEKFK